VVRYNVTISCTEEPLWWDAGRWWCQEFLCEWWQLRRPVHVHLPPGNRDHPDCWWAAQTRTDPILHLYSYHQLTCPEVLCQNNSRDWILFACFSIGCSPLLTEVEDSSSLQLAVVKNITMRNSCPKSGQIQSKFWPEPDLAGFPKKGRIPDLPEPDPKSGTSLHYIFNFALGQNCNVCWVWYNVYYCIYLWVD